MINILPKRFSKISLFIDVCFDKRWILFCTQYNHQPFKILIDVLFKVIISNTKEYYQFRGLRVM